MLAELNEEQEAIVNAVSNVCGDFDDDYWYSLDESGEFPIDFCRAMAEGGWLGITMPEAQGGSALGVTEAALVMNEVAKCGGMTAASSIHICLFGPHPIVKFGTEMQKNDWLPPLIAGQDRCAFGVTEPNAGLDTTNISTFATKCQGGYRITGQKMWTTTAQVANKILLLVRTTKREDAKRPTDGISLFYTDLDRSKIEVRKIRKMGRKAVDSNAIFIDDLYVPDEHLIGVEGDGFKYILHSLNPERILMASEAIGCGQDALRRATEYASERSVFGRLIGQNQAIQHPLAENWMELEAAWALVLRAAGKYDKGLQCGADANAAKFLGARAGHKSCLQSVLTHGGMGYAKEYHVERLLREVIMTRIAPVSEQMIQNFIGEKVLGLPKSY